jgi:methionine-rich copper-binding protein CopC
VAIVWAAAKPFAHEAKAAPALKIKAKPPRASVVAGAAAKFTLKFGPGLGRPVLKASHLPSGAKASFKVKPARVKTAAATATMTVSTSAATPAGSYSIALKGTQTGRRGRAVVRLAVTTPARPAPVAITEPPPSARVFAATASLPAPLVPGVGQKLDVLIQNLTSVDISIQSLTLKAGRVDAPQASAAGPCSAADFSFTQLSGAPGFTIPAGSSRKLSELGVSPERLPSIVLQDRPSNQDGCQNASVTTEIEGSATGAHWAGVGGGGLSSVTGVAQLAEFGSAVPKGQLFPGGSVEVDLAVTNPNPFAVHITSLALDASLGTGGFEVDAGHAACALSALHFSPQTNNGPGWQVPAKVGSSEGSLLIEMPAALSMDGSAANACQGATFTVHLKGGS